MTASYASGARRPAGGSSKALGLEPPQKFAFIPEGRLIPELREAAQTQDPVEILARPAAKFRRVRRQPSVLDTEAKTATLQRLAGDSDPPIGGLRGVPGSISARIDTG